MDVRKIRIEDFDYPLPEERIALHPLEKRDACKLLAANSAGRISHHVFSDLPILVHPDTLIVANETRVIRARMEFIKESGARIEIFLLEPLAPHDYVVNFSSTGSCSWMCMVGNRKRWKENPLSKRLTVGGVEVTLNAFSGPPAPDGSSVEVRFEWDNPSFSFAEIVEAAGNIPIPPYLKRQSEESDTTDYQTVYSRTEGSVAAPTAGLHFTPELISELKKYGNEFATVTLHVGAGTFQPVKSDEIGDHPMHTEWISVGRNTLRRIINALENGRDILAVGTTSVRTLESLPYLGMLLGNDPSDPDGDGEPCDKVNFAVTQWMPYEERFRNIDTIRVLKTLIRYLDHHNLDSIEATTSIMIAPGFRWRIVNRLVTNFHQPKSTLLLLVSSFLEPELTGTDKEQSWRRIYTEALKTDYRFLSYGDACLFTRGQQAVELPVSKSMALRAAMIYAVRYPDSPQLLDRIPASCDDVNHFISSMRICMKSHEADGMQKCYIGDGAAPLRFLLAYAASLPGAKLAITSSPQLSRRPIRPLIDALVQMGANIEVDDSSESRVIRVIGTPLSALSLKVDTSFTSQYLSALMLVSPLWTGESPSFDDILAKASVSRPYLKMTEEMIRREDPPIESDWSAAAFFYEYSFISGKPVEIATLTPPLRSLQGDSSVCDLYGRIGVNTKFHSEGGATLEFDEDAFGLLQWTDELEFDFTDCPDMVPSVAVALCSRRVPFRFHGVGHLRYKECDRLSVIQSLLLRIGYDVSVENETLIFSGEFKPLVEFPVEIEPFGDHRMAMAFYPLELLGMVNVMDKDVVSKSFPDFYLQFKNFS